MTQPTSPASNRWIVRPRANPQARLRLFCFPYAGGGAAAYSGWSSLLPPSVDVCAVQPPGREARLAERPFERMTPLIEALSTAMLPLLHELPFAFFGHSMGALTCFELARQLRRQHGLQPVLMGVSAHRAPQLPDTRPPAHLMPDPELREELRRFNGTPQDVLDHPELMELMLPLLRADFALCETYQYSQETPLSCPMVAFGGLQDPDVDREALDAWRSQTSGNFSLRMLPGDHFFLHGSRLLLVQTFTRDLLPWIHG